MTEVCQRFLRDVSDSSYFLQYAQDLTSQGGEDGIIEKIFDLLDSQERRCCVEVGSWDGVHLSNTHSLLNLNNAASDTIWDGLLLEADAQRSEQARQMYSESSTCRGRVLCKTSLVSIQDEDSANSLTSLMNQTNIENENLIPCDFDLLSIDIDGNDYYIWQDLIKARTYRPKLVIIEFNPSIGNNITWVQAPNMSCQQGSSVRAIVELCGNEAGYCLITTTIYNAFFIRSDLLQGEKFRDFFQTVPEDVRSLYRAINSNYESYDKSDTSEKSTCDSDSVIVVDLQSAYHRNAVATQLEFLRPPSMVTEIFQTYDGELKYAGPQKLLWHRLSMNPQKLQVLPKRSRKYAFAPKNVAGKGEGEVGGGGAGGTQGSALIKALNCYFCVIPDGHFRNIVGNLLKDCKLNGDFVKEREGLQHQSFREYVKSNLLPVLSECFSLIYAEEDAHALAAAIFLLHAYIRWPDAWPDSDADDGLDDLLWYAQELSDLCETRGDVLLDGGSKDSVMQARQWLDRAKLLRSIVTVRDNVKRPETDVVPIKLAEAEAERRVLLKQSRAARLDQDWICAICYGILVGEGEQELSSQRQKNWKRLVGSTAIQTVQIVISSLA
jgi:hypothetical protein